MARHVPDPNRPIEGTTFQAAIDRLAERAVADGGGTKLRALADLRAAVEECIKAETRTRSWSSGGTRGGPDRSQRVSGDVMTWREVGDELGVSAQAAHRRYGHVAAERDAAGP
ncbi:hypothetical protein [Actinoplanes teichomyceticus]|uniref:hypothetical protein n=1 Tax=Actinoplanes teichomyceticus TaxID=1867 RepID=UPI001945647C|nr:hypothetical protein [Actinoplanes teichomyceticus]GIF15282.1 hypothetical protein Ate01nite_53140 [Actinoplanes teichomyceticus]